MRTNIFIVLITYANGFYTRVPITNRKNVQMSSKWLKGDQPEEMDKMEQDQEMIGGDKGRDKDPIEKLFNFFFGDVQENPQGLAR